MTIGAGVAKEVADVFAGAVRRIGVVAYGLRTAQPVRLEPQ